MKFGVIFDLDGTLAHTLPDLTASATAGLAAVGLPAPDSDSVRLGIGNGTRKLMQYLLPEELKETDALEKAFAVFTEHYGEHYLDETRVFPGLPELVAQLKQAGVPVAVVSNKPHDKTTAICQKLYPGLLDPMFGGRPDVPMKPDPTAPLSVAAGWGLAPEQCFFVGDSSQDMETANRAGMIPVGVLWGYRDRETLLAAGGAPERLFETAEELAAFFARQ